MEEIVSPLATCAASLAAAAGVSITAICLPPLEVRLSRLVAWRLAGSTLTARLRIKGGSRLSLTLKTAAGYSLSENPNHEVGMRSWRALREAAHLAARSCNGLVRVCHFVLAAGWCGIRIRRD